MDYCSVFGFSLYIGPLLQQIGIFRLLPAARSVVVIAERSNVGFGCWKLSRSGDVLQFDFAQEEGLTDDRMEV